MFEPAKWFALATAIAAPLIVCGGNGGGGSGGSQPGPDSGAADSTAVTPTRDSSADGADAAGLRGSADGAYDVSSPQDASPSDSAPAQDSGEAGAGGCAVDAGWPEPFDGGVLPAVTDPPQVVLGSTSVLHHATFISVSFPVRPFATQLEDFLATLGCTDYWRTVGQDYGVGAASAGPPVHLTEQAPSSIDDMGVQTWLVGKIDGHDPLFPRPAPETIYVIWYPLGTNVTSMNGAVCNGIGGYHGFTKLGDGTPVPYTVVPQCSNNGPDIDLPMLTNAASHELVETATDPYPTTIGGAYELTDDNHFAYVLFRGGEVGDLCELEGDSRNYQPAGYPYQVQRMWSNRAAALGMNPCVPADDNTYFYAAAALPDRAMTSMYGQHSIAVVHVPLNATVTVPVKVFAHGVGGPIRILPSDVNWNFYGVTTLLALSFGDGGVGGEIDGLQPGDTVPLTITKMGTNGTGFAAFLLYAQTGSGNNIVERAAMFLTSD